MTEPLFDLDGADELEQLSAGRRLTLWQRQAVDRGVHPLTGQASRPDLGTCGDCRFRRTVAGGARSYPKCSFGATSRVANGWPRASRGQATDVRAWWPACAQHQPRETS